MKISREKIKLSNIAIRAGLGGIFLYFGILAVQMPLDQATIWIQEPFFSIISNIIPISTFMLVFGVVEILLALAIFIQYRPLITLFIAFLLMLGIIINLSLTLGIFNDIVVRDIAIALLILGIWLRLAKY